MSATYCLVRNILLFTLVLSCLACTPTLQQPEDFSLQGFQKLFGHNYPISFVKKSNEQGTSMVIEYLFTKTDASQHYIIELQFSAPASLLVESDYLAQYQASLAASNSKKHKAMFPAIGYRAQYTFLGAGPGGAAERLIFTSSNRHYDVKIMISHLLPNSVATPPLNLETIAAYVDKVLTDIQFIKD